MYGTELVITPLCCNIPLVYKGLLRVYAPGPSGTHVCSSICSDGPFLTHGCISHFLFLLLLLVFILFLCIQMYCLHVLMCYCMCASGPQSPEEGIGSPGTGPIERCELPWRSWEEQSEFLNSEPFSCPHPFLS